MSMVSLDRTVARLMRAVRSRSNLRPAALFCLGVLTALLGMAFGLLNKSPQSFAILAIFAGVALGAFAVAAVMLRPDAANDN